jgi:hypothetical protein
LYLIAEIVVSTLKTEGEDFEYGKVRTDLFNLPCMVVPVIDGENRYLIQAQAKYGPKMQIVQVLWTDRESRFPYEPEFNREFQQELLTRLS